MTSTIAQVKADADRLKLALMTHLSVGETGYDDNDIVVALKHAGVKGFNGQFLGFSVLDIEDDLVVPATTTAPEKPLNISDRRLLNLREPWVGTSTGCAHRNLQKIVL